MARQHRVTALGLVGAGKTVYLTVLTQAIFKGEALARDIGWSLEPASSELRWNRLYGQLKSLKTPWPRSTRTDELNPLTIALTATRGHAEYRALEISYTDFSGEHAQPGEGIDTTFYDQVITNSDALLIFIDGEQLLALLAGQQTAREFYRQAVEKLMRPMELTSGPVHVVITKWDRMAGRDDALAEARDALRNLNHRRWQAFLATREHRVRNGPLKSGIVRLIPVSSVGREFARAKNANFGSGPDTVPRPFNVEMPLVAALRDLAYVDLQKRYPGRGRPEREVPAGSIGGDADYSPWPLALNLHLHLLYLARLVAYFVLRAALRLRLYSRRLTSTVRIILARQREPSARRVRDEASALEFITAVLERRTAYAQRQGRSCILVGDGGQASKEKLYGNKKRGRAARVITAAEPGKVA
jgi:hypothetical protein